MPPTFFFFVFFLTQEGKLINKSASLSHLCHGCVCCGSAVAQVSVLLVR